MDTLAKEIDKYRRMWAHASYRISSPGLREAHRLLPFVAPGESLVDLGCGTGRASKAFADRGLRVTCVDFVKAIENDLPFVEANLWGELDLPVFDWVYCVDVLEHIPPEYLDAVLNNIAKLTGQGGYIQAACFEDGCGSHIGETLHLTVQPPEWWVPKIRDRWIIQHMDLNDRHYARFLVGAPHGG